MLRVSVSQIPSSEDGGSAQLLARFSVDAAGIHPEAGERIDVIATIPVIDPDTGERLESGDDPVRWAWLLPLAIRSGDLAVLVEEIQPEAVGADEDGDPIADLADEVEGAAEYVH